MTIDLWTVIWTIISFFLLYFLLNTFLYKPLLKFMDERRARINAGLEEGRKAQQEKEENQKRLEEDVRKTGGEAKQLLADAKAAGEAERSKVLEGARDEATAAMKAARERVQGEEKTAMSAVEESMPELVSVLAARLLGDEAVVSANSSLIGQRVSEASGR